jgi:hypothetical protein
LPLTPKGSPARLPFLLLDWKNMISAQRPRSVALALLASTVWTLLSALAAPLPCAFAQSLPSAAQLTGGPVPPHSSYLALEHLPPSQINRPDASLIRARQRDIFAEAAFFGYDLTASGWDYELSVCPILPNQLVLHYKKSFSGGAQSLFTALVPRADGRVYVVPILYRNATPFRSSTGSDRTIAVFNRIVPPDVAQKAVQPDGKWLVLGLCYADIAYGNANALNIPGAEVGLTRAPIPLLRVSEVHTGRAVVFTDRNAPGEYLVWTLTFSDRGRLIAASAAQLSDYVARIRSGAEPKVKPMPPGKEPTIKPLPPGQEPPVKPLPEGQQPQVTPLPPQQEPPVNPQAL